MVCISEIKIEHFFFLQSIDNQKIVGHQIPMIDLGKSKKVTAVLKLNFLPRGATEYLLDVKQNVRFLML